LISEQQKYDKLWNEEWKNLHKIGPSVRSRNRILLKFFKKYIKQGKVLDSGCGDGTFLDILNNNYSNKLDYEGTDISKSAINLTKKFDFVNKTYITDLEKINTFPKKKYDAVISSEVLEHINDWKLALKNLTSVVESKGYVFITVPHGMKYWARNDEFAKHFRRFEKGQIESVLKKLKFEIKESLCWGFPIYWLYYTLILNNTNPKDNMSKKNSWLKKMFSNIMFLLFHIDDLFNNTLGRRLFIVARKR
jgi:ubiquinone/menaquinone biosynthesis C-methylase UbiE